jgi:hypothetical protein
MERLSAETLPPFKEDEIAVLVALDLVAFAAAEDPVMDERVRVCHGPETVKACGCRGRCRRLDSDDFGGLGSPDA